MSVHVWHEVAACASTQDLALELLAEQGPGTVLAVHARSQTGGRGREGRSWHDPPGIGLLLSVAARGPLPVTVLDELPRRVVDVLIGAIERVAPELTGRVAWRAPNDLVAPGAAGAKLGGILVDVRTIGAAVEHVVVGIGCNVAGPAFVTPDGRRATTLEALGSGAGLGLDALARDVAGRTARLLSRA